MFVKNLDIDQQKILLGLSRKIIRADGQVATEEANILSLIESQCSVSISESFEVNTADLASYFKSQTAKVSLLLELISVANVDNQYHANEKNITLEVAKSLDISLQLFADMESWVARQFSLIREANSFMEE